MAVTIECNPWLTEKMVEKARNICPHVIVLMRPRRNVVLEQRKVGEELPEKSIVTGICCGISNERPKGEGPGYRCVLVASGHTCPTDPTREPGGIRSQIIALRPRGQGVEIAT